MSGWVPIALGVTDEDAIHDNVADEFSAITQKATPVDGDLLLIEDSADSFNKKYVEIGDLPSGGGGGGTALGNTLEAVDPPPGSPNAMDDEFNDGSFDTGLWSDLNIGSTTKTEAFNALKLSVNENSQQIRGIYQTAPSSGSPWEFRAKVSMPSDAGGASNQAIAGIFAAASTTGIVYNIGWYQDAVPGIRALQWATPTSNLASWGTDVSGPSAAAAYFKMVWTGSDIEFYWSTDGVGWSVDLAAAIAGGWTPGIVGLGFTNRRGTNLDTVYDWFRRTA